MEYVATLESGEILRVQVENADELDALLLKAGTSKLGIHWLRDRRNIFLNLAKVSTLKPVQSEDAPETFRDAEGDIWERQPDGLYAGPGAASTLAYVREQYGMWEGAEAGG